MQNPGQLPGLSAPPRADLDQDRLVVKVARLYYESGITQARIAARMRLSRQKVQRLLDQAKVKGVVRIVIEPLLGVHAELEKALEDRYGLAEAVVVETSSYEDQEVVAREVGVGAAEYLLRVVKPRDRIVISWGGALLGMVDALRRYPHRDLPELLVVQGLGALADPGRDTHSSELARRMAHFLGGRAISLPAPGIAGNRAASGALYKDAHIGKVLELARDADIAFVGIGAPRQESILVRDGSIVRWEELEELMGRGAVGDVNLRYFDSHGRKIVSDLDDRTVGLSLEDFQRIPRVVGLAGGAQKLRAIQGALAGGLVHVLITDDITARKLLEEQRSGARRILEGPGRGADAAGKPRKGAG